MGELATMGKSGDLKIIWDPDKQEEVDAAKKQFEDMKKKGYVAFSVVGAKGEKGEVVRTFDPKAERIILAPPMVGG